MPRPPGVTVFGTRPNDLLQFDYLDLGKSTSGNRYVFMMREDHNGYTWLYPTPFTSAEEAAHAI